jgi:hypothetical protein
VRSPSARSEWSTTWVPLGLGLAVASAACSQGGAKDSSPSLSRPDTSAATAAPRLTAEQAEIASALARYDRTLEAMSGGEPLDIRKIRAVATEPKAEELGNGIQALKAFRQKTVGRAERKNLHISVNGAKATVRQCADSEGTSVVSVGPRPTVVSRGSSRKLLKISMIRNESRWLVSKIEGDGTC